PAALGPEGTPGVLAGGNQAFPEPVMDGLIRSVVLWVRWGERLAREGPLRRGLEIGNRPRSHCREQRGAVRPALFAIDGRDGKTKNICLQLPNKRALRASARQQEMPWGKPKLLENGE